MKIDVDYFFRTIGHLYVFRRIFHMNLDISWRQNNKENRSSPLFSLSFDLRLFCEKFPIWMCVFLQAKLIFFITLQYSTKSRYFPIESPYTFQTKNDNWSYALIPLMLWFLNVIHCVTLVLLFVGTDREKEDILRWFLSIHIVHGLPLRVSDWL
jgi:hypothetical protein